MTKITRRILIIKHSPTIEFFQSACFFEPIIQKYKEDKVILLTCKENISFAKSLGIFDYVWQDELPKWYDILGLVDIIRRLRKAKFDIVIDLQNDKRTNFYFRMIGFRKPLWSCTNVHWASHHLLPLTPEIYEELYYINDDDEEEKDDYTYFDGKIPKDFKENFYQKTIRQLSYLGIKIPNFSTHSNLLSKYAEAAYTSKQFTAMKEVSALGKYVILAIGGDKEKLAHKWDIIAYSKLADYLHNNFGLTSAIVGKGIIEKSVAELLIGACKNAKPINIVDKTNITQLFAVIKGAEFCVSNDTLPAYIAMHINKNLVVLCSRYSDSDIFSEQSNVWLEYEPMLENLSVERVTKTIESFYE